MRIRALTVSELNKYIKKLITNDPILNNITLKGEISNLKYHGSGHVYLSLKDELGKINCVMFKENVLKMKFRATDGMKIIVKGYVSTFERDGQYQMYIREMEPDGIGGLSLAFEQLKIKLQNEGLFQSIYKKKIPTFPEKIAVITSPTGAAIRDIISVIKRRNPHVQLVIYPVRVQGESAPKEISQAIERINENQENIDLIITGRGGGSIEELWAFNEEIVARSVFESKIPIISAVGHETDYTISDFVADLRAPTPSAAAELAVPHVMDIKNSMNNFYNRMNVIFSNCINENRNKLLLLDKRKMKVLASSKVGEERQKIDILQRDLLNPIKTKLESCKRQLIENSGKFDGINPFSTISRGYGMIFDKKEEKPVKSIKQIEVNDHIHIMLTDGNLSCIVSKKEKGDHLFEDLKRFRNERQ